MGQLSLFDQPPPTGRTNATVEPPDVGRADRLRAKLLAYLKEHGQATTGELVREISHRFGARKKELVDAGYLIDCKPLGDGNHLYIFRGHRDEQP